VVSSTAGASLRQALVLVFERGSNDEKRSTESLRTVLLPDGVEARLTPNEWDAYHLFSDLCSLTSRSLFYQKKEVKPDRQEILRLSSITPTFGLELIESILSGFAEGFRKVSGQKCEERDHMLIRVNRFTAAKRTDRLAKAEAVPCAGERFGGASLLSCHAQDRASRLPSLALFLPANRD